MTRKFFLRVNSFLLTLAIASNRDTSAQAAERSLDLTTGVARMITANDEVAIGSGDGDG